MTVLYNLKEHSTLGIRPKGVISTKNVFLFVAGNKYTGFSVSELVRINFVGIAN